jgi:hypothetical protein
LLQAIVLTYQTDAKIAAEGRILQNSLLFSLLSGNLTVETGSMGSASATTQSDANRRFLVSDE